MTDFGTKDGYVGAMKGVILGINPQCTLVDITHEISPQEVFEGALVLGNTYRCFPRGSIHLAVVDPEVGTQREALVVEAEGYYFVGPDNGLFTWIYRRGEVIFAPTAGYLSLGRKPELFGARMDQWREIDIPEPRVTSKGLTGEVIHIDRFGNVITNLRRDLLEPLADRGPLQIHIKGRRISGLKAAYAEAREGELMAVLDSFDLLEISLTGDSAGDALRAVKGDRVELVCPRGIT
jgi:S-adenosylmethionine hydrolase